MGTRARELGDHRFLSAGELARKRDLEAPLLSTRGLPLPDGPLLRPAEREPQPGGSIFGVNATYLYRLRQAVSPTGGGLNRVGVGSG